MRALPGPQRCASSPFGSRARSLSQAQADHLLFLRAVRCNRVFPKCDHCTARREDCDLKDWRPKPKVKPTDPARVAALEKRLGASLLSPSQLHELSLMILPAAELEEQVAHGGVPQPFPPGAFDFPPDIASYLPPPAQSTAASASAIARRRSIGPDSLDWRLAEPHMASSLSRHLCDAFADSCCFLLPTWEFFRTRMGDFLSGREDQLSAAQRVRPHVPLPRACRSGEDSRSRRLQVALTTFCAIGARSSPHSVRPYLAAAALDAR